MKGCCDPWVCKTGIDQVEVREIVVERRNRVGGVEQRDNAWYCKMVSIRPNTRVPRSPRRPGTIVETRDK